mmetsp:Transcript_90357/g.292176  ORF Transcript_90357/g.292176 Transcript_90357/m.292176 type:complete len:369 (+) Transcript_90357:101-1207(+)|eukprot:CAMPEP_0203909900 /NCGR_PEP_ID=MMETSP0359-20131031/51156_1 /ASSEMBLY_ACC=CAM_ASM_000338 /TAXON_ID=268821 /ORGANISM="Scrippsiella Hangoei, Strain SHTV-5" /LENGTH=368 /DNA_ID=CAMNT_0050835233 /DNA_START=64 /DNA_END=1170 /DNA_ORIENTATION=-
MRAEFSQALQSAGAKHNSAGTSTGGRRRSSRRSFASDAQSRGLRSKERPDRQEALPPCALVCRENGEMLLLLTSDGSKHQAFEGQSDWIAAVDVHWQTLRAASVGGDGCLRIWQLKPPFDPGEARVLTGGPGGCARAVAVDWAGGSRALTGSDGGQLVMWDLEAFRCEKVFPMCLGLISSLAVNWAKLRVLVGHGDSGLLLMSLEDGEPLVSLDGHTCLVTALAVNWDKNRSLCGSGDGALVYWDMRQNHMDHMLRGHKGSITAICADWFLNQALSGSEDGHLRLWALKTGECLRVLTGHQSGIRALDVDWQAGSALSGSSSGELLLWMLRDASAPQPLAQASSEGHGVIALALWCPPAASGGEEEEG